MLTEKQERFCLAYIETGNASEAYRRAYNAKKMKSATVNRKAAELMKNGKITARVAELRQPAVDKVQYTLEMALNEATEAFELGKEKGNPAAMVAAVQLKSKLCGLFVDKLEVGNMTHEQALKELA